MVHYSGGHTDGQITAFVAIGTIPAVSIETVVTRAVISTLEVSTETLLRVNTCSKYVKLTYCGVHLILFDIGFLKLQTKGFVLLIYTPLIFYRTP